jgi:hypothetical protein
MRNEIGILGIEPANLMTRGLNRLEIIEQLLSVFF